MGSFFFSSLGCPKNHWGKDCEKKCLCQNNAFCDPFSGKCKCDKGYIGAQCENRCPDGMYGQDCTEQCRCENGGKCDHIFGGCVCSPGWTGPL
jgi:multiple epidermal growth factor-like domains protein 10/11